MPVDFQEIAVNTTRDNIIEGAIVGVGVVGGSIAAFAFVQLMPLFAFILGFARSQQVLFYGCQ